VRAQAERFAARKDVLATTRGDMTTSELVQCERRLIDAAVGRGDERCGLVDSRSADRALASG
jgi:hypothetical protein